MKHVVSISLGSHRRDKKVETELMEQQLLIERIGADGDPQKARELFQKLDGQVDCFGVGGVDLGFEIGDKYYPFAEGQRLVKGLKSPAVDGTAVRWQIERQTTSLNLKSGIAGRRSSPETFCISSSECP
jgi:hypothetical protein